MYSARGNMEIIKNDIVEAVFQIDEQYNILSGDERVYQLFGDNTMHTFNKLIYPDDYDGFVHFIESEETDEPYLARCMVKNHYFRWLLFYKKNLGGDDFKRHIEIKVQNVVAISQKFDEYFRKMKKYRNTINMIKDKLFEYDFKTKIFTIYCYINNRSEIIEKDYFPDWKARMLRLGFIEEGALEQFNMFCQNIENGADSFSLIFETSLMSKGERKDMLNFRGQTLKDGTEKTLVTGLISELGVRMHEGQILISKEDNTKDSATGILNKKTVQDDITEIINKANVTYSRELMYLVIMDIDDFKKVNDTYGHYFGDEVVLEFAQKLKSVVGNRGIVGRIGGDEFIALIKDIDSEEDVRVILKTVRKSLEFRMAERKPGYHFTISAGVSQYGVDASNFSELFKIADAALYIAKGKGKDRFIIYDPEKHGAYIERKNGRVECCGGFMQPMQKYDLATHLIIRLENKGKGCVEEVLYEMMDKLNIHGATVYYGEDMQKKLSVGHYQNTINDASYIKEDDYYTAFDDYGVRKVNNSEALAIGFPDIFRQFKSAYICSALQILLFDKERVKGMLQFDIFGENRRKWNDDDVNVVRMVSMALGDIFTRNEEKNT